MILSDAKCPKCGKVFEVYKKALENWSELKFKCPSCNFKKVTAVYSLGMHDTCKGICGNNENGYSKGMTYHSSKFGRFKGTKV